MRLRRLLWFLLTLASACCPAVDPPGFCWYDSDCGSGSHCEGGSSWCGGTCVRHQPLPPPAPCGGCGSGQYCDAPRDVCRWIWTASFLAPADGARVPVNGVVDVAALVTRDPGFDGGTAAPPSFVLFGAGTDGGTPPSIGDLLPEDAGSVQYRGAFTVTEPATYDLAVAVPGAAYQDFLTITAGP